MTKFKEGNKYGKGKPKGTPNKVTRETKEIIKEAIEGCQDIILPKLLELSELDPAKFLQVYTNLCEFILPKLTRQTMISEGSESEFNIPMITWIKPPVKDAEIVK